MNLNSFIIEHCGDYFDFPRLFIVKISNSDLLFYCSIDEKVDRYVDHYVVSVLNQGWENIQPIPWMELMGERFGQELMRIRLDELQFSGPRNQQLIFNDSLVLKRLGELYENNQKS